MEEWEREKDPIARMRLYVKRYSIELVVISILMVCSLHFFIGRTLNKRLAN